MDSSLKIWDRYLLGVIQESRAGSVDPMGPEIPFPMNEAARALWEEMVKAHSDGIRLSPTLKAVRHELRQAQVIAKERRKMLVLLSLRLMCMLFLTLLLRIFLMPVEHEGSRTFIHGKNDAVAMVLGLSVIILGTGFFVLLLPRSWAWEKSWTPDAARWVACHLFGAVIGDEPWGVQLHRFGEKSSSFGINLLDDMRAHLEEWADEINTHVRLRLVFLEELIPLWELGVLGLGSMLLMIVPLTEAFFLES